MPAFIRYPFFGCVILALSACGGSGSSRLLESTGPTMGDEDPASTVQTAYSSVEYLITDIPAAIAKFATDTSMDMSEDMSEDEGMMDDDETEEESPSVTDTGARPLGSTPANLTSLRNLIVGRSTRYLSTGAVLEMTDNGSVMREHSTATCTDAEVSGPAKCVFRMDSLRDATTFHLGSASSSDDENTVSFRSFMADREPVMIYREALMSQVRTMFSDEARVIYEDGDGNEYLLTSGNVRSMELTDATGLPTGVTLETAPDFADLLAVYEDEDENRYLLTPSNVMDMDLTDVELPTGVTTAPDFASLSRVMESQEDDNEEYVGYDGMLEYSMFFVGVHRFFDEGGDLQHTRYVNASLGRIYDEDALMGGIQSPSMKLTGEGVMIGMESKKASLEHYLVQGDVNIMYDPSVDADDTADPPITAMEAMIDISIDNIQRLADDGDAWYASSRLQHALTWTDLVVTDSKFSGGMLAPLTASPGKLEGSFYGTETDPEVGGVFHHEDSRYEIVGSFGSKLTEPEDDPDDTMNP